MVCKVLTECSVPPVRARASGLELKCPVMLEVTVHPYLSILGLQGTGHRGESACGRDSKKSPTSGPSRSPLVMANIL